MDSILYFYSSGCMPIFCSRTTAVSLRGGLGATPTCRAMLVKGRGRTKCSPWSSRLGFGRCLTTPLQKNLLLWNLQSPWTRSGPTLKKRVSRYFSIVACLLKAKIVESQHPAFTREWPTNDNRGMMFSVQSMRTAAYARMEYVISLSNNCLQQRNSVLCEVRAGVVMAWVESFWLWRAGRVSWSDPSQNESQHVNRGTVINGVFYAVLDNTLEDSASSWHQGWERLERVKVEEQRWQERTEEYLSGSVSSSVLYFTTDCVYWAVT